MSEGSFGHEKSSFLVCGTRFDIDRKYRLNKPIGHRAYLVSSRTPPPLNREFLSPCGLHS